MVYKSFGIIRTNVGLTTNIKLMVKSDYKLYLDSIDSNDDLSLSRFKKFAINKKDRYDRLIPNFFNKFPSDLAFDIKYDNDVDSMKDDFKHQYDEIYQYGARNIINNRSYSEEFEYFAPLYIFPDNLPNSFIIFRVDDPGLDIYNKDNFSELIVKNFKAVKRFDLTKKSPLGEWLDINYTRNDSFPISPLDIDFKINEFSKWYGIDYKTGGYVNKSIFLEEWFGEEKEIFEMEKFIFDGYKDKKVVFPNILNLSFLFDDTPSTADRKRKWSLNRYYGFYFDEMEHVTSIFPTKTKQVKEDISITKDNIITHTDGYPFIEEWNDNITNYIEIEGIFYRIERLENIKEPEVPSEIVDDLEDDVVIIDLKNQTETTSINSAFVEEFFDYIVYTYKIISTKTLSKFTNSYINKNTSISINSDNEIKISDVDYDVDLFDNADVWLIEINGVFHNIIRSSTGSLKLVTDYSFLFDDKSTNYSYKVGGDETIVSMLKKQGDDQEEFKIYKLRFTDLKDFDTRIIDTEPSKFEYELNDKLTDTDESKMYVTDLNSETNPKEVDSFVIDEKLVNIPVSSEYTSNYETFKITETGLTELWRKNSVYCRWGFQKSLSGNDYPYVLNNSLLFEDFNRTSNPFNPEPKRIERNLDYFYTINSDSSDYIHHTLHLEEYNDDNSLKKDYFFDLRKYLDPDGYDYYSNFFNKRSNFFNGEISRNTIKHSYFNKGDQSIPNVTLFRGIKFLIYDVEDIRKNENNELDVINLKTSNEFQDYKFSILLSDNKLIEKQTISATFSVPSCQVPTQENLTYPTPYVKYEWIDNSVLPFDIRYTLETTTLSYDDDVDGHRKLYHSGSKRSDLVGKYIILDNDSTWPDTTLPGPPDPPDPQPPTIEFEPFDFLRLRYKYESPNKDLDSRTFVTGTGDTDVDGSSTATGTNTNTGVMVNNVGYGVGSKVKSSGEYLHWGGDNTNSGGTEDVLINFKQLAADYPDSEEFKAELRAWWWDSYEDGNIEIEMTTWLDGVMTGPTNKVFENTGGSVVDQVSFFTNSKHQEGGASNLGDFLGQITYDPETSKATLIDAKDIVSEEEEEVTPTTITIESEYQTIITMTSTFNQLGDIVTDGDRNVNYGKFGAYFYPDATNITNLPLTRTSSDLTTSDGTVVTAPYTSDSNNTFWNSNDSTSYGRLNNVGIFASSAEWLGFTQCIEITETKVYYIGIAADNYIKFSIDGVMVLDIPTSQTHAATFNVWHVIPYTLTSGKHIIEVYGRNDSGDKSFGAEIYNPTDLETLIGATNETEANVIFSTADKKDGTHYYDLGETMGYSCPDGYSLDSCNSGTFMCTKITTKPVVELLTTTTTETECYEVLYKILESGMNNDNNYPYLVLGNVDGTPIPPDTYKLPHYLEKFKTIDTLNDYPYIELNYDSGVRLGDEIKITDSSNNTTYDGFVFETGFFDGDVDNYYIKANDISGDGIVIPSGDVINLELDNGTTGTISYDDDVSENMMKWIIIENWQMDKTYSINSYVSYDDIIYRSIGEVTPSNPTVEIDVDSNKYTVKSAPYNLTGWEKFDYDKDYSPFFNFSDVYNLDDIVYSNGDYYKCVYIFDISGGYDFWNPYRVYDKNKVVLHKGKYYESLINENVYSPSENYIESWVEITPGINDIIKWDSVLIWNPSKNYEIGDIIVHNEVVYSVINSVETGDEPGISSNWERITSLLPNSDFKYDYNKNPFIRFNNNYYLTTLNKTQSTLDNGIKIYINKKWENILVNIEIKDNTTPNLKNINRDELYVDLNKKLTTNNFINCINDFSNKYDFIDYLKYVIIEEDGSINEYDYNDIEGLPYLINCEFPDELEVKIDSLTTENIDLKNDLIAKKALKDGFLDNNEQINYYNGVPIAVKITENKDDPKTFSNFGGNKNLTNNLLYRFSGFYMPIFYDVHMFFKGLEKIGSEYDFRTSCVPPVSFSGVDTPNLPWHNHMPDGEFSGRTWLYDNKFDDIRYNIKFSYPAVHYTNDDGDTIIIDKIDVTPIKAGWDAVLVNYERHASEYYNYFPKDNKKFEIADFDSYPWIETSYLDHFHLGLCWTKWINNSTKFTTFTTKFHQEINNNLYRYKTPYDITPYVGWYILASDSAKNMSKLTQFYRDTTGPDDFVYYDHLRTFYTNCSDSINTPVIVMYKIETARFNEDSGFFEFTVVYPDGTINSGAIVNSIEDLVLVKNLHDNFGIFVESNTLELEIGDIVKITETNCDLSNSPEPYYIKSISEYEIGLLLDIYDDNDERVCLEDGHNGKVQLSKNSYTDNYKFNTDLTGFGNMLEKKVSKINRKGSVLKLKDKSDIRSIYPMLDEFGYTFTDFFVFKGTFDFNYHLETYGSEGEAEGLLDVNDLVKSFNLGKK